MNELSIVTLGHIHSDAIEPLTPHFSRIEQLVTDLPARVAFADKRAELNRAIDAASSDWILILREREFVDSPLGAEIAGAIAAADAWGFRIRVVPLYAGRPLRLGSDAGELRLFQRRHLLRRGELGVQGTVIRLRNALQARTFDSAEEHRAYLSKTGVPHSVVRRMLLFLRNARTFDGNTLRYLWIEAGFDHGGERASRPQ
ncbi:MAG TPA: hypothetical protein VKL19_15465 [Thermoanaerobaculia bacterium]|nr:hypothetical protein [Thermoanaerobaculia bacterium]